MKKEDFKIHCPPIALYDAILKSPGISSFFKENNLLVHVLPIVRTPMLSIHPESENSSFVVLVQLFQKNRVEFTFEYREIVHGISDEQSLVAIARNAFCDRSKWGSWRRMLTVSDLVFSEVVREISSDVSEAKEKKPEKAKVQSETSDKELIFVNLHLKERLRNASAAFADYVRLHAEKPPSPENSEKVLRNVLLQRHCDPDVTQSDAEEALMKYLMRNL